ncbi:MAG: pantoate--beta-alanine ligase [Candidatus Omnitrophota bacterium]
MKIITDIDKMKTHAKIIKKVRRLVGFVPTMGYLHDGHMSLIRSAKKQSDIVIASIFVNPIQFAPGEDFAKYPRDSARDEGLAKNCGVDVLFCPKPEEMYPDGFSTYVNVEGLTSGLCGRSRSGHFRGVTTVVLKLLEIIRPDIAYFGQKDAQQAIVIKKMIEDLNMDMVLKILPTLREADGLAMSSRNAYLSKAERRDANVLFKALKLAEEMVDQGERNSRKIIEDMRDLIKDSPSAKIDYVSIVDTTRLEDVSEIDGEVLIALALRIGKTRLIDNVILDAKGKA